MAEQRTQRKLAAILAADIVGYSRLMEADEAGTLARLKSLRAELLYPKVTAYGGRIVKTTGDGVLIEFPSAVDAVLHAIEVQREMARRNAAEAHARRIDVRMGINLGDILIDGDDIYGDGVNVAARLEGLAEPGGICVSGTVHEHVRGKVNAQFADMGTQTLKNIAKPVQVYGVALDPTDTQAAAAPPETNATPRLSLPSKPSIAVLAFQNMSGDPEQEYFADGIAEDVITALSRSRWLFVVARNSSFTYKNRSVDVRLVGRELGVHYVLEGSVRKAGARVRITVQLVDASNGHHVWADRYDRGLEDIFAVQDEMTGQIASAIAPGIVAAEVQRVQTKDPSELGNWERLMRAHWHIQRFNRDDFQEAIRLLEELLRRDPNNATALSDLAFAWHYMGSFSWADDPLDAFTHSKEAAHRAIAADDHDAAGHAMAGIADLFAGRHDDAKRRLHRAIELDPNSSLAMGMLAAVHAFSGEDALAIQHAQDAMRLSPRDYMVVIWRINIAWAHLSAGRFEQAAEHARRAADWNAAFADVYGVLACAYAHLDRMADARSSLGALTALIPRGLVGQIAARPFRQPADRERYVTGLLKAGLPDKESGEAGRG